MAIINGGIYGSYYTEEYGVTSGPLTEEQMKVNAKYIYSYLKSEGWTLNAIAGMLGNMQAESTINPGRWESEDIFNYSKGFGLVQWTPATKLLYWSFDLLYEDPSTMDCNLHRILYEVENNLQWIATTNYNLSFKEFTTSTNSVDYLSKAFLLNYERPADQSENVQNYRASLSTNWYTYLLSLEPNNPNTPNVTKRKKYKFLLFNANRRRKTWIKNNLIL